MVGIGLIIIGIIILLETFGVISGIPAGIVWGGALIVIGIMIIVRRSIRREQRMRWMAARREKKQENS